MLNSRATLLLAVTTCASLAFAAPAAKDGQTAEREKIELRFVEVMRSGLRAPPTDPAAKKAMMEELRTLMFALADIDPKNPPKDAGARIAAAQAEVLGRRDPALRDELLKQTELYACRSKQIDAKVGLKGLGRRQKDSMAEQKKFAKTLKELDPDGAVTARRYTFEVVDLGAKHFKVRAIGKDDMAGDTWEIDERDEPENTLNLCKKLQ
jgi:hypothetical protein